MRFASIIALAAATAALPVAGQAASVFFDEGAFEAAVAGREIVRQGFTDGPEGPLNGPTTFGSGLVVDPKQPTGDNFVADGVLRLSVDNSTRGDLDPATEIVDITLPRASSFFAFDFGEPVEGADNSTTTGRGPGNDSGTTLTAGDFTFDFSNPDPSFPSGTDATDGYTGFFGVVGDMGQTFSMLSFASNGIGSDTDDDFTVTVIAFEGEPAPIPLPAGLPLLALGLGALGVLRRRGA